VRIHSDTLTREQLERAADKAGVQVEKATAQGSRSRAGSWDVFLTGHGQTGGQWGNTSGAKTASWDEWGMFLAALYDEFDPKLSCRPYPVRDRFDTLTCYRFDDLTPDQACHRHRWQYDGYAYHVCKKCEAEMLTPYNAERIGATL
jgi:hypothetical protein